MPYAEFAIHAAARSPGPEPGARAPGPGAQKLGARPVGPEPWSGARGPGLGRSGNLGGVSLGGWSLACLLLLLVFCDFMQQLFNSVAHSAGPICMGVWSFGRLVFAILGTLQNQKENQ